MIQKQLKTLMNFVQNELDDLIEQTLPTVDIEFICDKLLSDNNDLDMPIEEALEMILRIAQYVETEMMIGSIMMDDTYDALHEKYKNLTGHSITGTNGTSGKDKPVLQHTYPELRGSIDKVHFIYTKEIPNKDSRKSLEGWLKSVFIKCANSGTDPHDLKLAHWFKYDGVSGIFEARYNEVFHLLTRKDTEANTGGNITHILNGRDMKSIFRNSIPEDTFNKAFYGVKTELLMTIEDFEDFKKLFISKPPQNHRSAVSVITNTSEEEYNPDWYNYLSICPVQISCSDEIQLTEKESEAWHYTGIENGRYQYIRAMDDGLIVDFPSDEALNIIKNSILDAYRLTSKDQGIPIDGVVFTILNDNVVNLLGRSDNKNKYQVAFKFAAGVEKSIVKEVNFSVGPITGLITPILEFQPVKIMGNTITNAGLSNIDKFERLNLHVGDEIMVKYNIVPTVYKTEECKESNHPKIVFPTHCPKCEEELTIVMNDTSGCRMARCANPDCPSKTAGKIANYVNKIGIMGIGLATIEDLISNGVLETIGDLYRIQNYEGIIVGMPGYGKTSFDNLVSAIHSKLSVYPHELLGSLGIPDVGRRIMKKVCSEIDFYDILNEKDDVMDRLIQINGIGSKMAVKICEGVFKNATVIQDILRYITIKPYEEENISSKKVLFSKVRDAKFSEYLKEKWNMDTVEDYTKDVELVIVKDDTVTSTKIKKAKADGKLVMPIDMAKSLYRYEK